MKLFTRAAEHLRVSEIEEPKTGHTIGHTFSPRRQDADRMGDIRHLPQFEKLGTKLLYIDDKMNELADNKKEYRKKVREGLREFKDERNRLEFEYNSLDDQLAQHIEKVYPDRKLIRIPRTADEWQALCRELWALVPADQPEEDVRFDPPELAEAE